MLRVVHQGQRLPLGLEAGDHLARVHAGLDDLQGDQAPDRLGLLGHVDRAHAAFADLLQELVGADDRAGALGCRRLIEGGPVSRRCFEKRSHLLMMQEQLLDLTTKHFVVAALPSEVRQALFGRSDFHRLQEDRFRFALVGVHSSTSGRIGLPKEQCDDGTQTPPARAWFFRFRGFAR